MFDFSFSFSSFIAVIKLVNMSDHYRLCVATDCRARLPAIKYDRHTKCPECIGKVCGAGNRCDECSTWTEGQFASFIKHKKKLKSDRVRNAKYSLELRRGIMIALALGLIARQVVCCLSVLMILLLNFLLQL